MKRIERETERARRGWWNNRLQLWHERESAACGGRCHIFFFFFFLIPESPAVSGKRLLQRLPNLARAKTCRASRVFGLIFLPVSLFIYREGRSVSAALFCRFSREIFTSVVLLLCEEKKGISKWKIFFYLDSLIKLPLDNLGEMNYTEFNRIEKKIIFLRSQQLYPNFLNPKI